MGQVRANNNNTGIIYKTRSGDEVEIPIGTFDPRMTDSNHPNYHEYNETSDIPGSEDVTDKSIIERNFLEEPAPTFGLYNRDEPVTTGSESFGVPVGMVTHVVVTGPNGETIIVNVTKAGEHLLHPGIIVRELYEDENGISHIDETGVGTGLAPGINEALADGLWQENANRIGAESVEEDRTGQKAPPPENPNSPDNPGAVMNELPQWMKDVAGKFFEGVAELPPSPYSPLVFDLDGDGIELSAMNGTGAVYFDMDNDGFAERAGWITGGDGLLALDRNGNGTIDAQNELFGDTATASNGFENLKALDSNADNKITSADAQWNNLRMWVDVNADGVSQAAELKTLASLGITSINLAYSAMEWQRRKVAGIGRNSYLRHH